MPKDDFNNAVRWTAYPAQAFSWEMIIKVSISLDESHTSSRFAGGQYFNNLDFSEMKSVKKKHQRTCLFLNKWLPQTGLPSECVLGDLPPIIKVSLLH